MSRELSDAEVAALRSGKAAWQDPPAGQDPSDGLWKRAKWQLAGRDSMPPAPASLAGYGVKERLIARWHEVHQADAERLASHAAASTSGGSSSSRAKPLKPGSQDFVSQQQRLLFSLCDSYADVLYAAKPYPGGPGWSPNEPDEAMDAVLLHVLNHCAKTSDVIKRNNDKLKAQGPGGDVSGVPRDQGFTRPKALILLPMRNMAYDLVRRLAALAQKETRADSVQGKEKFLEQFVGEDDDDSQQQQEHDAAAAAGAKSKKGPQKPAEHRALFRGNLDDHFRLGIRITRGQIKLFADFLQSDIIVASPVALATKLAEDAAAAAERAAAGSSRGPGGRGKGKGGHGAAAAAAAGGASGAAGEADFLSSIEVCVVERADVMLMQNWQHVVTVLEALNQLPRQQHGTDIMRVRLHLLASQGQLYRQTIMSSSFASPQLNAAFSSLCCSHAGKFRLVAQPSGVLGQVVPQVRQLFERFAAPSSAAAADARFEFFKASLWPRLAEAGGGGLLLVVPSYFDFVRLRNFLKAQEAEFAVLSEYCSFAAVTRARALFFQRRVRLMLYTERAHFYHRYRIRGIQDIMFYGLPEHAHFYSELVNLVQSGGPGGGAGAAAGGHHATITALFCQFDALALSRVVGQGRAAKMLAAGSTPTFVFC
ncbi:hypothetical protein OEZ86_013004 [Tetradesmus obliquus]|nr:hypothetical protein OEZ86_013004 [Tetradesmus obliquus]